MSGHGRQGRPRVVDDGPGVRTACECTALDPVVDFVGYGAAAAGYAGSGPALGASNTQSVTRNATLTNTANNAADFAAGDPDAGRRRRRARRPAPRSTATIAEVQGTGATSPLAGQTVTTDGVVTAAYPTGGLNGYVIQTPGTGGATDATPGASDARLRVLVGHRRLGRDR